MYIWPDETELQKISGKAVFIHVVSDPVQYKSYGQFYLIKDGITDTKQLFALTESLTFEPIKNYETKFHVIPSVAKNRYEQP